MKSVFAKFALSLFFIVSLCFQVHSQNVLDPNDPLITYDPASPPTEPAFGQIGKWVRTVRLGWNTNPYKAYIYKGVPFRLMYPRTYNPTANDGKKYPILIFFHGLGEAGPITDNEFQLYHGGDYFRHSQNNGAFDGYVLFMQSQGFWGGGHYDYAKELIDYMVANNKVDAFRVAATGLSAGGQATWEMALKHPTYVTAMLPMSNVAFYYRDSAVVNTLKFKPLWNAHGGLDPHPAPSTAFDVRDSFMAAGANYRNVFYPELGHDTWNRTWNEPDFWPFMMVRPHGANPWPLFGRTEFCPSESINATLGLTRGFDEYQWRRDGILIPGANAHTLTVTQVGTYSARTRRGNVWSDWSPTPVQIKIKAPTVTPPIQVSGNASRAIPSVTGATSVQLEAPDGFVTYEWQREGSAGVLSTTRFLTVTIPGDYKVRVTEQFGCASSFSPLLRVVDANGTPKPDAPSNLLATALSQTSIRLDWSENPNPIVNETNFEIYQATKAGGPYTLAGTTGQNIKTFTITGLSPNVTYYYRIRALNNTGVSGLTNEASAKTLSDLLAPTSPLNLETTDMTRNSVALRWGASTDNVGVSKYEIFINGVRSYITTQTQFLVTNLQTYTNYVFTVRAIDASDNASAFSNQVSVTPTPGLKFKYYTFSGQWNLLPDFAQLTAQDSGYVQNVTLSNRTRDDQFAFLWEGYIRIPVTGTYYFRTRSDDGSKLYLGALGGTTSPYSFAGQAIVNNDGLHAAQDITSGPVNLQAGVYPIAIAFYEQAGQEVMEVSWRTPQTGNSFVPIPNIAFIDQPIANVSLPAKPSNLVATPVNARRINLSWNDNSNNEQAFEVWRSINPFTDFRVIGRSAANSGAFADTTVVTNTRYYYKVRAVNQNGESDFDLPGQGVDYGYYQQTGLSVLPPISFFTQTAPLKSGRIPNFDLGMQDRPDNFQLRFSTTITVPSAGVYTFYLTSDDGSKLYIGGFNETNLVINNDGQHGPIELSKSINLSRGSHTIDVIYFESGAGETLSLSIAGPGMTKQRIPDAMLGSPHASAFASSTIPAPAMPNGVVATGVSTTNVQIVWQDRSSNESGFAIQRSADNGATYLPLATVGPNVVNYTDTGLFANAIYYYRVSATGPNNNSAFATPDSAKTLNSKPVIQDLVNRSARFGVTTSIALRATDVDGDALVFTGLGLPAFASIVNGGNNTGTLVLSPTTSQQGTYNNLRIVVSDPNGGSDTTQFNLVVNDNFNPVITSLTNQSVDENQTLSIPLAATDQNANDLLTWSVSGVPNNFTLTQGSNGSAVLAVTPTYSAAGVYTVTVNVSDNKGGIDEKQFTLTVRDKDPNLRVYMYMQGGGGDVAGSPWNRISQASTSNLRNDNGDVTSIGLSFPNGFNTGDGGAITGNNTGVYPDPVLRNYFVFGAWWMPQTGTAVLTGLDPTRQYNVTVFGNSNWNYVTDNGFTRYTVGGVTDSIYVQSNFTNTKTFTSVQPASNGTISITMTRGLGASAGFLNSIVLESKFQDGTVPLAPTNLTVNSVSGSGVILQWKDNAYNETGFEIYRSGTLNGTYSKVGTVPSADSIRFTDATATGNATLYYYVRAINTVGPSGNSNTVSVTTPNRVPSISGVNNINIKSNQSAVLQITAADDPGSQLTIAAAGLPSIASFTDNGNGTATLQVVPNAGSIGFYRGITITATDQFGASSTATLDITITDNVTKSVYLNFTTTDFTASKPWNNLVNPQFSGTTFSGIRDDNDQVTNMVITMPDGFEWTSTMGMRTVNGRELYPQGVSRGSLIETSTTAKRIVVSGLNAALRYNFVFFSSREDGRPTVTNYTINGQTVSLDGRYNTYRTVQLNGIEPNANGQVTISVAKAAGTDFALVNSMVIQEYNPASSGILAPTSLRVTKVSRTAVSLQWQDRSNNDTGFEIYRSQNGGSYALLATTAANITSFTDSNLQPNTTYFYTVRAKGSSANSPYSNAVRATTLAYQVYINFNSTNPAGAPWNNTNAVPQVGTTYANLKDDSNVSTSLSMVLQTGWSGLYGNGMTTGNNSGIVPDNVMIQSYGNFSGVVSTVRITGLNMGMKYNFSFFASSQNLTNTNSLYTINGRTTTLNAAQNRTGFVTVYDVVADANGEAVITAQAENGSEFGLIGAIIIDAFSESSVSVPAVPSNRMMQAEIVANTSAVEAETARGLYPNPFGNYFNLAIPASGDESVDVRVFDVSGRLVFQQRYSNLVEGQNVVRVQPHTNLGKGIYQVVVTYLKKGNQITLKAVKQ